MPSSPGIQSPSDEQLACEAQQGVATSFESLLRRFQVPLLHFLENRGSRRDAEDLVQETFLRAYTRLDQYDSQWRFGTWLFTIARRVSINHQRRDRPATGGEMVESLESPVPEPYMSAVKEEGRRRLWAVVARTLSEEEQTALWLHYVEDMPVREIAAVLERSRVAVKTMMFRARKKLLPLLCEFEPEVNHG